MLKRRSYNRNKPGIRPAGSQSLARGLAILERFTRERPELGVRELSRQLGISPTVIHRLVRTLTEHGFLEQNPDTLRYGIGIRAFEIGNGYLCATGLEEAALPVLRALTSEHELNAYLGVLHRGFVSYLVALQSSGPIVIRAAPGSRAHVHSTALGKVLLAAQPDEAAARILGRRPLPVLTPKTRVDPVAVLAEVAAVRRTGYAVSDEENIVGVLAVGASVRDRAGHVVAAISAAAPRYLNPDDGIPRIARVVTGAAEAISRRLGFPGLHDYSATSALEDGGAPARSR
jgi:DNA-binding IclR family transcriptional regulator